MAYTNTSNKLVIREGKRLSGMIDSNHLSTFANINPQMFDDALQMAFGFMQYPNDPIRELTQGRMKVRELDGTTDTWTWKQAIRPRPAVVLENLESTNSKAGIDRQYFKLKLDQDWFSPGEVLTTDKQHFVRISQQMAPYQESGGWVYTVQLVTDNALDYYPQWLMRPGSEYVNVHGVFSEQSSQATSLHFEQMIELKDQLPDMIRLQHKVTGYVDDRVLQFDQVEVDDSTGNVIKVTDTKWISRAELKFWKELDKQKGNMLFWGRGSQDLDGEKGYKTRSPYGFKQQLEWGNVETYGKFDAKLIRDYLMDVHFGRVAGENRNIELMTGEIGMRMFDEAFKDEANKFLIPAQNVIQGTDNMNLTYGYQIKAYRLVNGGTVTLKHLPYLDVDITNNMRDPRDGYPIESKTFYITDLSGEGADNIYMVRMPNTLKYGYVIGTSAPWELKGSVLSNTEDAYTLVARDRCGIWVKDVTRTGILKPSVVLA